MFENAGELPYKKRKNKTIKKSDHKHEYELQDREGRWSWFNKVEVCKICKREGNRIKI